MRKNYLFTDLSYEIIELLTPVWDYWITDLLYEIIGLLTHLISFNILLVVHKIISIALGKDVSPFCSNYNSAP